MTWNAFGGDAGVQSDEYRASPAYVAPLFTGAVEGPPIVTVTASIDVTQSLRNWSSDPFQNFGWISVRTRPTAAGSTPPSRPRWPSGRC